MNVGSLFSGIGGMDHGLARAGFDHAFFCESDEWRRGVLAQHWPGVPIYDDVRSVGRLQPCEHGRTGAELEEVGGRRAARHGLDLLSGGFPCQDLSVAGNRAGLAGERSGLFFEFARIINALRPRWVLIENVPGLLSSNGGRDFGIVLGTLADLGYGVGWRTLDSRFFGVPQRRRRVFILATIANGDPRGAAQRAGEVLAVGSRCTGHSETGGEAGQDVAQSFAGRSPSRLDDAAVGGGQLVASPLRSHPRPGSNSNGSMIAAPLTSGGHPNSNMPGRRKEDDVNLAVTGFHMTQDPISTAELAPAMGSKSTGMGVGVGVGVRRLTPTECERLQSLPDGWTDHGPDSRRYSALGDAVTASVAEWIGQRLLTYDDLSPDKEKAASDA